MKTWKLFEDLVGAPVNPCWKLRSSVEAAVLGLS